MSSKGKTIETKVGYLLYPFINPETEGRQNPPKTDDEEGRKLACKYQVDIVLKGEAKEAFIKTLQEYVNEEFNGKPPANLKLPYKEVDQETINKHGDSRMALGDIVAKAKTTVYYKNSSGEVVRSRPIKVYDANKQPFQFPTDRFVGNFTIGKLKGTFRSYRHTGNIGVSFYVDEVLIGKVAWYERPAMTLSADEMASVGMDASDLDLLDNLI